MTYWNVKAGKESPGYQFRIHEDKKIIKASEEDIKPGEITP